MWCWIQRRLVSRPVRVAATGLFVVAILTNYLPPPSCDLCPQIRRQIGILVRLIAGVFGQVFLHPGPRGVETAKSEMIVQCPHLTEGIADKIFVLQLVESRPIDQGPPFLEVAI